MITKSNLLDFLEKSLANEDEFIIKYGNDFLRKVNLFEGLKVEEKEEITNMLSAMLSDTERHAKIVGAIITQIQGDSRNEY